MTERRPDGTFAEGQSGNLQHGGERALRQLRDGRKLSGVALELQKALHDEIEMLGWVAVLRERAERHGAVADLFYGLILGAKDIQQADAWAARFGWLNAKAFRMLQEVAAMEKSDGSHIIDVALQAAEEATSG